MNNIEISLIVPALNEAENLAPLAQRVDAALKGRRYELLIVDDNSRDKTPQVCAELSQKFPLQLLVRHEPRNGLSGAVLHGMEKAQGEYFVVMDADLQHPPEKLPELVAPLIMNNADFVIGSRYVSGGTTGQKWGLFRLVNSKVATVLARPFSGRVSDPMSGFFALRRSTYQNAQRLTPLGYKIGLELMCKCRVQAVREIPIHFAEREHGQSKLSMKQQFKYLEHLSRLYDFCFPRLSPALKFLAVTALSWFVGFAIFFSLYLFDFNVARAPAIAYLGAIAITTVFHARYVRTQREFLLRPHPWRDFLFCALAEWAACSLTAVYLGTRFDQPRVWELFVIPFGIALLVRYVMRKELVLDLRGLRPHPGQDERLP